MDLEQVEEIIKILNSINKTIDQIITSNVLTSNNTTLELEYLFPDKEWPKNEYVKDKDV